MQAGAILPPSAKCNATLRYRRRSVGSLVVGPLVFGLEGASRANGLRLFLKVPWYASMLQWSRERRAAAETATALIDWPPARQRDTKVASHQSPLS